MIWLKLAGFFALVVLLALGVEQWARWSDPAARRAREAAERWKIVP